MTDDMQTTDEFQLDRFRSYLLVLARMQIDRRLASKVDASDIVQQTMLQAHRALEQFRGRSSAEMAGWLRQILARNVSHAVRDFTREKRDVKRERSLEASIAASSMCMERWLVNDESSPSSKAERSERLLHLAEAVEQLSAAQRDAIVMHYWQGMKLTEVAQQLGRTTSAVAGLLHRGLEKLRNQLQGPE